MKCLTLHLSRSLTSNRSSNVGMLEVVILAVGKAVGASSPNLGESGA